MKLRSITILIAAACAAQPRLHQPAEMIRPAAHSYVTLFGAGLRSGKSVQAWIGRVEVPVHYVGPRDGSPGEDRIELGPLPASLAGRGLVDIEVRVDGRTANPVRAEMDGEPSEVTFSSQIVRIFQKQCQSCHRPGEVAPFSLLDYASARPWARAIKSEVLLKKMPPWKPVAGHGEFRDERRLTDAEIALISRWVDEGAPEGNRAELPEPLVFPSGWILGEPDLTAGLEQPFATRASTEEYRCFSIPVRFNGDRPVAAVEVQPGNRKIVHHVLVFADPAGASA